MGLVGVRIMIEIDLVKAQGNLDIQIHCKLVDKVTGVFGRSGAGKTTLLNMIAGLTQPDVGRIVVEGEVVFDSELGINRPLYQRRISTVFQDSRLFPHLNVSDNLNYGFKQLQPQQRQFSFKQVLELLEIGDLIKQKPHQLSGGEKQRVALGRALLASPRLLLLDEPLASLDVRLKYQILPFLQRIKKEMQMPMIFVSHALNEILYLTSKIAMLESGKLLAVGEFNQVIHDPSVLALAQSLGLENVLYATIVSHHPEQSMTLASIGEQQISVPLIEATIGTSISIAVAASAVALSSQRLAGISIQNQLVGTVTAIQEVGSRVLVSVNIGAELIAEITVKALADMHITLGCQVICLFKMQGVHTFTS